MCPLTNSKKVISEHSTPIADTSLKLINYFQSKQLNCRLIFFSLTDFARYFSLLKYPFLIQVAHIRFRRTFAQLRI